MKVIFANLKNILTVLTILFSIFAYFYVKDTLAEGDIRIEERVEENNTKENEVKPVKVTATIKNNGRVSEYNKRLDNTYSVHGLLEEIRKTENLTYEVIAYTNGVEISEINNVKANENFGWTVYEISNENKTNISEKLKDINLKDGATYEFVLEHRNK